MKTNFIEGFTASCIILLGIFVIVLNANAVSERTIDPKLKKSEKESLLSTREDIKDNNDLVLLKFTGEGDSTVLPADEEKAEISDTADVPEDIVETSKKKKIKIEKKIIIETPETKEKKTEEKETAKKEEKEKEKVIIKKEIKINKCDTASADDIAEEIAKGIEQDLIEMNIDLVVDEVVAGIQSGLHEMNLNAVVKEAIKGTHDDLQDVDVEMIINEALIGIQAAMEEMDLNVIVEEALTGIEEGIRVIEIEIDREDYEHETDYEEYDDDKDCPSFTGNTEHLNNLKKGASFWNTWRAENKKEKVDLRGACLHEAILTNMNLSNASLENIDLGEAVLNGTDFTGANLGAANLKEASMHSVDLSNSDLRNTNLKEASLKEVNFSKSDLRGVNLSEAMIDDCIFKGAIIDNTTLLPPGFSIDK